MIDFSIITVNYNGVEGLGKTIQSVVRQNYSNYEYIVIDGGSTDGSKQLIEQNRKNITFWCSEPDSGIYNAMNKGIPHATGEYILFLNGGDVFHSDTVLSEVKSHLDGTDIISGYALINNRKYLNIHEENVLIMLLHSTFSHQATFIRRELFDNYKYDEHLKIVSDWEAWVDWVIMGNRTYKYINTIVSDYDLSGISSDDNNLQNILDERRYVLSSRLPEKVLDNLMKCNDFYLKTHYKYIDSNPYLKQLAYAILKSIAFFGKLINKKSIS